MNFLRSRLTYANVMSSLAVFLVLGGGAAFAAFELRPNSVGTRQLQWNAVTAAKIKADAITTAKIADGAVVGAKIQASTLGTVPSAETADSAKTAETAETAAKLVGDSRRGAVHAQASAAAATFAESEAASPEIPLLSASPFAFYAKCFDFGTETIGAVYIRTSENGAVFAGTRNSAPPFLDTTSAESSRRLGSIGVRPNTSEYFGAGPQIGAVAPNGTAVSAVFQLGAKKDTLPGGDGVFGAGDTCMFSAEVHHLR